MHNYLSELTVPFLAPIGLCLLIWMAGLLSHLLGYRLRGRLCTTGGILLLLALSSPAVGRALLAHLEDDFPLVVPAASERADAIVVLGGVTAPAIPPRHAVDVGAGFDRLLHGLRLLRFDKAPLLILSGGAATELRGIEVSEADRLYELALEYGVEPARLWREERSDNTHENALFTGQLLNSRGLNRVLLVTSAYHMPRAAAAFEKQGLRVVPAPTDVRVIQESSFVRGFMPGLQGLEFSTIALREYFGLAVYWGRGWI